MHIGHVVHVLRHTRRPLLQTLPPGPVRGLYCQDVHTPTLEHVLRTGVPEQFRLGYLETREMIAADWPWGGGVSASVSWPPRQAQVDVPIGGIGNQQSFMKAQA